MTQAFQSTYSESMDTFVEGQVPNSELHNSVSRTIETVAGVGFGKPVAQGSADRGAILMASGEDFIGITKRDTALDPVNEDTVPQYAEASIVDHGPIVVRTDDAVAAQAAANYDTGTGNWTDAAVAGNIIAVPGCKFVTSTATAGLAVVKVTG